MKKKLITTLLATSLIGVFLTGCSFDLGFGGTPKTAVDVIEKYQETNETANFHMEGDLNFSIGMEAEGMTMDIPIELGVDIDYADEYGHGEMDMKMSFLGENMNKSAEMYITEDGTYTFDDEVGYWTFSESDSSGISDVFDAELFENATLEVDKKAKTYTITQSLGDLMESDAFDDSMDMDELVESMNVDSDDLMDAYKDSNVIYVFDTDYNLLSAALSEVRYEDEVSEDGYTADVSVSFEFNFEFSNFGEIEVDDVKVPKDVKTEAVESDDSGLGVGDFESVEDEPVYDNDAEISEIINDLPTDVVDDASTQSTQQVNGNDILGSYNGLILGEQTSWHDTFGADGWSFTNEDGEYSFMTCENPKYDGVELYVYNQARNEATADDIYTNGFFGWSCDVSYATNAVPDMTFNGLTWGASNEDVLNTYGSPDFSYEGSMWTSYEYGFGDDITMTFYVYPGNGLQKVDVAIYNF